MVPAARVEGTYGLGGERAARPGRGAFGTARLDGLNLDPRKNRDVQGGRLGLVNVVGSSIARACDGGIYLHAGPEVSVASTKALTNMALSFALLALNLGRVRDLSVKDGKRLIAD